MRQSIWDIYKQIYEQLLSRLVVQILAFLNYIEICVITLIVIRLYSVAIGTHDTRYANT